MSNARNKIKSFKFTRREKRGSFILLLILVGIVIIPKLVRLNREPLAFEFSEHEVQKTEVLKKNHSNKSRKRNFTRKEYQYQKKGYTSPVPKAPFDPDTMSAESWRNLGLSERQAEVLISYKIRLNGFYNINQLYDCYVLDSTKVDAWKPFLVFNKKKPADKKIEINTATKEELMALKGIGDKLSDKIINYRQKLGGFVSIEQIGDVYGLSPETFQAIKPKLSVNPDKMTPININKIEIKELSAHPYFTYQMAKLIINYRLQHGPYSSMDELVKSKGIESEDVQKVEPYINFAP